MAATRTRKRFGQHFLAPVWVERVLEATEPSAADVFIEIGSGRGALTLPLARRAGRVVAIEIDRDLVADLRLRVPSNVAVVCGDVLSLDLQSLVMRYSGRHDGISRLRVSGNLPYNISSPVLFQLFQLWRDGVAFQDATLMLQREVVDRVTAVPGSRAYGPLAIFTHLHADARRVLDVPAGAFRPVPQVRSALVQLRFRSPNERLGDARVFEGMVRRLFMQRRKTLLNALRPIAADYGTDASRVLAAAQLDPGRRPETLQVTELAGLADVLGAALP